MTSQASKRKDPTVVAFATQKGGAGKSTAAIALASYLYFDRGDDVYFADADHPQYSVRKLRDQEIAYYKQDPSYVAPSRIGDRETIYPIEATKLAHVLNRPSQEQASSYEKAAYLNAKYLVVDTPGSVTDSGLAMTLRGCDHIVVPLEPEDMSMRSTVEFLAALRNKVPELEPHKILVFWNKIRIRFHQEIMAEQTTYFLDNGYRILSNYVPFALAMNRDDTRSTLQRMRIGKLNLRAFMEELTSEVTTVAQSSNT